MIRAVRLSAALLLAGLALVSLPGAVSAQGSFWKFERSFVPDKNEPVGVAISFQDNGGHIGFACMRGEPQSNFEAYASTGMGEEFLKGNITVAWKIDDGPERKADWLPLKNQFGGVALVGQGAYEFAQEIRDLEFRLTSEDRVILRTPLGAISPSLKGASFAIFELLRFCELRGVDEMKNLGPPAN